jgi:cation:H+ antiporter
VLLLAAGFAAVLAGALLFTNAVEWAGSRLGLGVGAVGTILAAASTALPESVIPVVAMSGETRTQTRWPWEPSSARPSCSPRSPWL